MSEGWRRALAVVAMGGVAAVAEAQPSGFALVSGDPLTAFRVSSSRATSGVVDVDGPGFSRAFRIDVREPGETWDVELGARLGRAVDRGEVAYITFHARAFRGAGETGEASFSVYAQKASPDWNKSLHESLAVGADWQAFTLPFTWGAAYAATQASFVFGVGGLAQGIEIGSIEVVGFGPGVTLDMLPPARFTYAGRGADDPWRAEAAARIEAIRKGDLVIEVVDDEREGVEDAEVRVEQRRHAFPFGSALQAARLTAGPAPGGQPDDNAAYRHVIETLFNAGSLENDTKWPPWEGDWGAAFNQAQTLAALDWMRDRGLRTRGHVLVWPGWNNLPQSLQRLRGEPDAATRIPQRVLDHIDDVTARTASYMDEWDVINEPYTNHDLMDLAGNGIMVDWFVRARQRLPHAGLVLNDYDILSRHGGQRAHQDHFEATARFLIESGAPITGLGLQGHFGASPTSMATVKRLLDRYAALGLSLRITEFDIDTADEALQADYTRDFLTMVFSHPAVAGFQMWGFWEGAHWLPRAAMYRRDWSEKPNGETFRRLVHEVWRTAANGRTDDDGRFATRAFHGQYEVTVTSRGRTRVVAVEHVSRDGPTVIRIEM
ncbi:MAG: endo-1,4-beta-xylanase [Vicinamibacteraceae bacterium]